MLEHQQRRMHGSAVRWSLFAAAVALLALAALLLVLSGTHGDAFAQTAGDPDATATVTATPTVIDDYSGTKQPGPALTPGQTPVPTPTPIDTVQGDRVDGPPAPTSARPVIIERDRGVDWTVPLLLAAAALTLLGLGAVTAAVRSR